MNKGLKLLKLLQDVSYDELKRNTDLMNKGLKLEQVKGEEPVLFGKETLT